MSISIKRLYIVFFLAGIFFIPFNSWEGIKEFGEFKREASAYFFLVSFLLLIVDAGTNLKVRFPWKNRIYLILILFMAWCAISLLINFPEVADSFFKETTGINRFIRQYFVLVVSAVIFFAVYFNSLASLTYKEAFFTQRRIFLWSFVAVSIYGFLEIAYVKFGFYPAYQLLRIFDYFPFVEWDTDGQGRISSVTWEPPALATFLIIVAGWMFSYLLTEKSHWKFVPTALILILTYFSGSRTALIVVLVQLAIFLYLSLRKEHLIKVGLVTLGATGIIVAYGLIFDSSKLVYDVSEKLESLDFRGNLKKNISNQSRFGIQYANMKVFSENPIAGVGFGQQAFHGRHHYPLWAKKDNWEFKYMYLDKKQPMFAPGYNLYIRLLAETGVIGFLLFAYFLFCVVRKSLKMIKSTGEYHRIVGVVLLVSFAGYILNWLQMDTFRNYGFWIALALLLKSPESSTFNKKVVDEVFS